MKNKTHRSQARHLPITRDLKPAYTLSLSVVLLMAALSLGGLTYPSAVYPGDAYRNAYLTNDLVNLLLGVPILLVCMWLTWRGKRIGLLCWPGALLYTFYNYLVYLIGMPLSTLTLAFGTLVFLSGYGVFDLLSRVDRNAVQAGVSGRVPERLSGGLLIFFGVAFFGLATGVLAGAGTDQAALTMPDLGLAIADMILSALLAAGGVLLFRHKPLGYASGLGLFFATSALFVGLMLIVVVQPVLTGVPFSPGDLIVLAVMGLVCFIPTGLYARGVLLAGQSRE
jgi:hypothetical protein